MLTRRPLSPAAAETARSSRRTRRRPAAAAASAATRTARRRTTTIAAASSSGASSSRPQPPPPIVEWCPAGADASVDEDESEDPGPAEAPAAAADAWRRPLEGWRQPSPAAAAASQQQQKTLPPVVALGKFDALHRGHRALARAAAVECGGAPVLVSFTGMAAVLGWPRRRPLVARQDRARVLALWARELAAEGVYGEEAERAARQEEEQEDQEAEGGGGDGGASDDGGPPRPSADLSNDNITTILTYRPYPPVRQRYLPFASVRALPPEAFVDLLRGQMKAAGAVAGANFRFGFKAAGDSAALERLCQERGMRCSVVGLLMRREAGENRSGGGGDGDAAATDESGAVSSSRVREQLAAGRVEAAARSLGRPHRVVYVLGEGGTAAEGGDGPSAAASSSPPSSWLPLAPADALRNQPPSAGEYRARLSCYALEPGMQARDCCLLELEARERQRRQQQAGAGPAAARPAAARAFREEVSVRVAEAGALLLSDADVVRRCCSLHEEGDAAAVVVVVAVDLLGRAAGRRPEVATEEEEEEGGG